jgi:hypothetical protein
VRNPEGGKAAEEATPRSSGGADSFAAFDVKRTPVADGAVGERNLRRGAAR